LNYAPAEKYATIAVHEYGLSKIMNTEYKTRHYLIAFTTGVVSIFIAIAAGLSFWTWIIGWVALGVTFEKYLRARHKARKRPALPDT